MERFLSIITIFIFICFFSTELIAVDPQEIEKEAEIYAKEWNGESIRRSIQMYEQSTGLWLKENQINKATKNLREIVKLKVLLSQPKDALETIKRAQFFDKKVNNISGRIENLFLEFLIELNLGNLNKAEINLRQLQDFLKQNNEKQNQVFVLFAEALFSYHKHENQKSIEFFEKAINIVSEIDSPFLKAQLNYEMSNVLVVSGKYEQAQSKADEALANWKLINEKSGIALTLLAIGDIIKRSQSNRQLALDYYQQAQALFPTDMAFYDNANLLNSFASIYEDYNSHQLSLNYRKKALEYFIKANHPLGQLTTLLRLAELSLVLKDEESMFSYLKKAEIIARNLNEKYLLAIIDSDYGNYYFSKEDLKKSELYFKKALATLNKEIYRRDASIISLKLGEIALKNNNFAKAKRYFENSYEFDLKTKNKLELSETLFNFAKLDWLTQNKESALKNIVESLDLTETLYANIDSSNLKRSYLSTVFQRYEFYIHLLMQKHKELPKENFALQALRVNEKARSRSLVETLRLSEANFIKDANPDLLEREKEVRRILNKNADKLTDLLSQNASEGDISRVENEIKELENELENIKAKLKQESPVYSTIKNPPAFDLTQFQINVLDDKSLLLEFSLGEKESYLWVVSNRETSFFVLPARETIENRIEKIHQTFDARQFISNEEPEIRNKRIEESEKNFNLEAAALSKELLGEAYEKLQDKRLIIVPDGKLAILPLSVLPIPNTDELLISRHEIVYQPSASFLSIMTKIHNSKKEAEKDVLIFADPVFSDIDTRLLAKKEENPNSPSVLGLNLRDFRLFDANGKIPRLFATQDEADSIAETVGRSKTTIISGFAANRDRVLTPEIKDYRILHFATHGLIDLERPEVSSIVLSQFDENGEKQEGFLRLQDIYALDLTSDLVVLSACQTGIGKEIKGEGLMSLNNAFLQAGVKTVISSAWKVDDTATAELMRKFYFNLMNKRLNPSESLRLAQLEMSNSTQFKSPFYWAAFTIQGEFRQPITTTTNYFYYFLPIIILIFCGGLFWYWRIRRLK